MTTNTKLTPFINAGIVILLALLIGGLGVKIAGWMFLNTDYEIPWNRRSLAKAPKEMQHIEHVDIHSTLDDPTGDTIFLMGEDGEVYSNTLFENEWLLVEAMPEWETSQASKCAPEWPGAPSDAQIWNPPPVSKNVVDSFGVRFERPFSIIVRCYVLSGDGSLEVWIREDSGESMGLFEYVFYAQVFGCVGVIAGIIIGVFINRLRRKGQLTQRALDGGVGCGFVDTF